MSRNKPPPGFLTKITSIAIGKELALINPLSRYSVVSRLRLLYEPPTQRQLPRSSPIPGGAPRPSSPSLRVSL